MYYKKCLICDNNFKTYKKKKKYCSEQCYHKSREHKKDKYFFNCKKCNKEYELLLSKNNYLKGKFKKYCSLKCANSRIVSDETKTKISKSCTGKKYLNRRKKEINNNKLKKDKTFQCIYCKKNNKIW